MAGCSIKLYTSVLITEQNYQQMDAIDVLIQGIEQIPVSDRAGAEARYSHLAANLGSKEKLAWSHVPAFLECFQYVDIRGKVLKLLCRHLQTKMTTSELSKIMAYFWTSTAAEYQALKLLQDKITGSFSADLVQRILGKGADINTCWSLEILARNMTQDQLAIVLEDGSYSSLGTFTAGITT